MSQSIELRRQIDDLALKLLAGGAGQSTSSWIASLERIRESAARDNVPDAVNAATAILQELTKTDSGTPVSLQQSLGKLQETLDREQNRPAKAMSALSQDPELLFDFILESREHLVAIEEHLLTIERDPHATEALNAVFRGFHTIKGLAGFLELAEVQHTAHEVETVLDMARNAELTITPPAIDVILQSADYLRRWITHLELSAQKQPSEAPARDEFLLARIRACTASEAPPETPDPIGPTIEPTVEATVENKSGTPGNPARHAETMAIKVNTAKLDYLIDMAGEMVIAESLVRHDGELAGVKSPALQRKMAQLTRITSELQKTAMAMRLVPVGPLFRRMGRLVRDLSRQFGKKIEMEMQGEDIELDRTIVEELADPLMHMVRNAADHGIELPDDRQRQGKNPVARLLLKAQHQAGQVVIEVMDDGRGLDKNRIRAKAIEKGLVSADEDLPDAEIHNLIFRPGFSTASEVTNVSGRGVGMDVVRKHIEKLRGRIEIRSTPGVGSTFLLKLPLTLAIIDGLVVGVGAERYILPLFAVREIFRPVRENLWTVKQRGEMAMVRGGLLPIVRLHRRFGVVPRSDEPTQGVLVVAEVEGERYCLLVDELIGKQEVVIKSLGELFEGASGVAGGAILGDGKVGLILDLDRIFKERLGEPVH